MDRQIQYPAQIPLVEDMLNAQRNAMVGIGHLAGGTFGANTVAASGFACAPGEGLTLTIAPGAFLAPGVVDASAYGTLAAVSSALVRQFISRDPVTLAVPAAGATYIVHVSPQTVDTDDTVLPFYNAADPSVTYAGENNSGLSAPTVRRDEAALSIGASVPEGSYPLWQIVVPAGAVAITTDMIAVASGAPFYPSLAAVAPRIVAPFNAQLAVAMGGYPLNAVVADPATPGAFWVSTADANVSTPGATGATWQSLFNGLATQAALTSEAQQRSNADQILNKAITDEAAARVAAQYVPSVPATGQTRITSLVENSDGRTVSGNGAGSNVLASLSDLPMPDPAMKVQAFMATVAFGSANPARIQFPSAFKPGTIPLVFLQNSVETTGAEVAECCYVIQKGDDGELLLDNTGVNVFSLWLFGSKQLSTGINTIPIIALGYFQ